ncbi:carboxypeptidase-like regulatory domain-containing protein [Salegentibacter sp. JZCK2]|uniref:carboxypeptidase-like regulatory domain-containing protein n=1 Tax=Salegentibacter tibetensis TaxID=2873600 RepID=UPI001CCC345C|nr:carboxypeptidase-like regulatory domain-containing protein [Salegentibacter tibetensis]MBZ9728665.1 carboxypeptidase-like regulatory domain-containing protein [Salegentibacter tibetensis]
MNLNLITNAFFHKNNDPLIFSRLSSSITFPKQIIFTPQLDYEYSSHSLNAVQGQLRKRIFGSGYLHTSYGYNFNFNQFHFNIGFNLNVGFSRFGLSSTTNRWESSFTETASGSLLFGSSLDNTSFSDRPSMDRANVKFIAFLDMNGNGIKDNDEPQLQGMKVTSVSGGKKEEANDGSSLFRGMEPYMEHHFSINTDHLNRIAWRVKKKRLNIYLNPNQMRLVEIPVSVVGEVGGFVLDSSTNGLGGIKVRILDEQQQLVKQIISEPDGFFNYLGLKSGSYTAQLDAEQLENLKLKANDSFGFKIFNTEEGDIVDNLEFVVQTK